jgi:hypothetical protein
MINYNDIIKNLEIALEIAWDQHFVRIKFLIY